MTNAASKARPLLTHNGLDFEVHPRSFCHDCALFDWTVFDAASGREIKSGMAASRELATQLAVRFIAERNTTVLHVLRTRTGWAVWHHEADAWVPLPLSADADAEMAREYVAHLPIARIRSGLAHKRVHVIFG